MTRGQIGINSLQRCRIARAGQAGSILVISGDLFLGVEGRSARLEAGAPALQLDILPLPLGLPAV